MDLFSSPTIEDAIQKIVMGSKRRSPHLLDPPLKNCSDHQWITIDSPYFYPSLKKGRAKELRLKKTIDSVRSKTKAICKICYKCEKLEILEIPKPYWRKLIELFGNK